MITKWAHCGSCKDDFPIQVYFTDYLNWQNGTVIQRAMPYLSADERELFISGTCGDCWDRLFGDMSDE